jgi:hypothetical protein
MLMYQPRLPLALANAFCATAITVVGAAAADNLSDPYVRLSAAGWFQMPAVTVEPKSGGSIDGGSVGLEDSKVGGMVDAYLDLPVPLLPGIHAGFWRWQESPKSGADVVVTGGYAAALWELELVDRVGVALGGGVLAQNLDPSTGSSERTLLPALAARGWFRFTDGISAEARLMAGAISDDSTLDAVAQLNWRVVGPLAIIGGYRQVVSEQKLDNEDAWKLNLGGPFLGASVGF